MSNAEDRRMTSGHQHERRNLGMAKLLPPAILLVLLILVACTDPAPTTVVEPSPTPPPTPQPAGATPADPQSDPTRTTTPTEEPTERPTEPPTTAPVVVPKPELWNNNRRAGNRGKPAYGA